MPLQFKTTTYADFLPHIQHFNEVSEPLRKSFMRAKHAGHKSLFGHSGSLVMSDGDRKIVFDDQAHVLHIASPAIRLFRPAVAGAMH